LINESPQGSAQGDTSLSIPRAADLHGPRFPWLGLLTLSAAVFLSVTGETLPTGLLPEMSKELKVSEPSIGLLSDRPSQDSSD